MVQKDILKIITKEPGIELAEVKRKADISPSGVSQQVRALIKWGLVRRQRSKTRRSDRLFPA